MSQPETGHWLIRLVKNGPRVPACIVRVQTEAEPGEPENRMDRSPFIAAFVNGEPVDIDRVWLVRGEPITLDEYKYRCAVTDWAIANAPETIEAQPTKRINLAQSAPIYRRRGE